MQVTGSSYTHRFTLVPRQFFVPENARNILFDVVDLSAEDEISYAELPDFDSVLIYAGTPSGVLPEIYEMLLSLRRIQEYNKIIASYARGRLFLVIAEGRTLRLCNSFEAQDFTTAEYFIFTALKRFQMNPEMSSIYFRTPLDEEQELSLYRYFKSVEQR